MESLIQYWQLYQTSSPKDSQKLVKVDGIKYMQVKYKVINIKKKFSRSTGHSKRLYSTYVEDIKAYYKALREEVKACYKDLKEEVRETKTLKIREQAALKFVKNLTREELKFVANLTREEKDYLEAYISHYPYSLEDITSVIQEMQGIKSYYHPELESILNKLKKLKVKRVTKPTIARSKNYLDEKMTPTHRCGRTLVDYRPSPWFDEDGEEVAIENLPEHYAKFHKALRKYIQQDTDNKGLEDKLETNRTKILFVYETLFTCDTPHSILFAWHEDPNNILELLDKENASKVIESYLRESILIYSYIKKLSKKPSKFRTRPDIEKEYPTLYIDDTQEVMMLTIMQEIKMRTYDVMETLLRAKIKV